MDANDYFQTFEDYFWEWVDGGEVIAMPSGVTIAYRDYVREVLDYLKVQGLPPFGSLLLVLIATNSNGLHTLLTGFDVFTSTLKAKHVSAAGIAQVERALPFLRLLSQVPNEYKQGMKRILLLQTLFRDCHNGVSAKNAHKLTDAFQGRDMEKRFWYKQPFNEKHLYKEFKTLILLAEKFPTVEVLLEAMANVPQTPAVPVVEEKEEVPTAAPKDFVEQLIENDSSFHVGALIRRIWSGLNIPFHNMLPSEQPLGGVSDISNKGDFDKLLISEFAYDDITFMSRLANNEALYINREIPPASNPMHRVILLDVSLKNWGTPKTIAYALMLAIAKHPKTNMECTAFAVGSRYIPVGYNDIHAVIDALQHLDGSLDSADGLELFFKEHGKDKNIEVFYISSFDAVKATRMQQIMAEHHARFKYWIHTNAQGNVSIYQNRHGSKSHLQDMRLPLEELWSKRPKVKAKPVTVPENLSTPIPSEYPILFASSVNFKARLLAPDGEKFVVTSQKSVMRMVDKIESNYARGLELVYESLAFAHGEYAVGKMKTGDYVLLAFNPLNRELYLINLNTGERQQIKFLGWKSHPTPKFVFSNDKFYYRNYQHGFAISVWPKPEVEILKPGTELAEMYKKLEEDESKLFFPSMNVLKNITEIGITPNGTLLINAMHELRLNGNTIMLTPAPREAQIRATRLKKKLFGFGEGSTVTIHPDGMLILQSANENILDIYIPTSVDISLGLAANGEFAGNAYFYKPGTKKVQAPAFWKFYMERFLDNILYHGTDAKTTS